MAVTSASLPYSPVSKGAEEDAADNVASHGHVKDACYALRLTTRPAKVHGQRFLHVRPVEVVAEDAA